MFLLYGWSMGWCVQRLNMHLSGWDMRIDTTNERQQKIDMTQVTGER